jgi:hypothetical protein
MKNVVMCIVQSRHMAEPIVDDLQAAGFGSEDISVVFSNEAATKAFASEHATHPPEGLIDAAANGSAIGGAFGLLAGIAALTVPGFGLLMAAGPLLGALTGATVGGVAGALVRMGIPETEARVFDSQLRGGHVLLSVHAKAGKEMDQAMAILTAGRGQDFYAPPEGIHPRLLACPACGRHVRVSESACPFCKSPLPPDFAEATLPRGPGARMSRAALLAFGATSLTLAAACSRPDGRTAPVTATPAVDQAVSSKSDAGSTAADRVDDTDGAAVAVYGGPPPDQAK